MSKIFAENLLWQEIQAYWKRFAGSVTAFADRYRFDPYVRTQVNVVVMLVAFSVFLLALLGILFEYLYHDVSLAIITSVRENILAGSAAQTNSAAPALQEIRTENLSAIAFITALATVVFGYLLTRVALVPTRNALASQKRFIGNIAHELRTPLSNIKTNAEVALLSRNLTDDMRSIFNSTIEDLDRLSNIINNLLSLSASVRPERIEFAQVDIAAVADKAIEKLSNLARMRNLEMSVRKTYNTCFVWGNPSALEQILTNVLKNSINYTERGGHIGLTIEQIGTSHVEIVVQDSGAGIARQDLFHIFEPFYRAEPSRNRERGGSGLGLTIVSELVKLHRGKITVRSALGRGTTVLVSLPSSPMPHIDSAIRRQKTLDEVAVDFSHRRL